jgi:hypothetical protein
LPNVTLILTGGNLTVPRYARTNSFGFYSFQNIPTGATYLITAAAKGYSFPASSQAINLSEDFEQANFTAER